ncbi:hypothetical protein [Roseateles saccharophilus]|uniref:Lipoprotein n=1 Tax=Roseateles saccharophilus TaxID=304 RepID=A0A4R3UUS2_ROSSA|nr:hypothetical protein [Roseateles saccharophilus]MDG0833343.1 hypothetical protein [Roseateles saccharophilus]TCU93794.1 hypothetical protein EV671_101853 [Roseateles saccharophilus]
MDKRKHGAAGLAASVATAVMAAGCLGTGDEPKPAAPVAYGAGASISVSLTLLKADAEAGRSAPIVNNHQAQVRFAPEAEEVHCRVELPSSFPSLEPGRTSNASLICDAAVSVERVQPGFELLEDGRLVGKGVVIVP